MKCYRIRTKKGLPLMIDPRQQIMADGSATEMNFTDANIAIRVMLALSADMMGTDAEEEALPLQIHEVEIGEKDIKWGLTKKDVSRLAEEAKGRKA